MIIVSCSTVEQMKNVLLIRVWESFVVGVRSRFESLWSEVSRVILKRLDCPWTSIARGKADMNVWYGR